METFSGYYSPGNLRPENNTLYDDFVMYVQITRCTVTYMERKIVYGIDLLAIYDKFRGATDPMPGHLFDLNLGDMLLAEVKYKGKLAVALQKQLESAYDRYFDDHGSLSSAEAVAHPHMVTAYTPGFIFDPKLSMASIRAQMSAGLLHMSCCSERDPNFQQWSDVQEPLKVMSTFRQDLRIQKRLDAPEKNSINGAKLPQS